MPPPDRSALLAAYDAHRRTGAPSALSVTRLGRLSPILERSGFVTLTTTTPYVWHRPAGDG